LSTRIVGTLRSALDGLNSNTLPRAYARLQYGNTPTSRFHLQSERVGIMALGGGPPKPAGKQQWDDNCLVLVVSKK
jgi:hypothetical protein